jgi:hypothetical protein
VQALSSSAGHAVAAQACNSRQPFILSGRRSLTATSDKAHMKHPGRITAAATSHTNFTHYMSLHAELLPQKMGSLITGRLCRHAGRAHARRRLCMHPCGPRARLPCGTPLSNSAQCRSRSTAAAAGPPPSHRTCCGTCARDVRWQLRASAATGAFASIGVVPAGGTGSAHPDHQQPTGRSAGVCRRRSSRLTSGSVSAGMRGATSASKAAKAEAMMANAPSNGLLPGSCGGAPSTSSRQSCRAARAASAGQPRPACAVSMGGTERAHTLGKCRLTACSR